MRKFLLAVCAFGLLSFVLAIVAVTATTASAQSISPSLSFFAPAGSHPATWPAYQRPMTPAECAKIPREVRADARGCAPVKQLRKKATR